MAVASAGLPDTRAASAQMNTDTVARLELYRTAGFLVADARGRVVGRVVGPMYGSSEDPSGALLVRSSVLRRRRRVVPAAAIDAIDDGTKVIGLRVDRDTVRAFS